MKPLSALLGALAFLAGCSYPHLVEKGRINEEYYQRIADGTSRARGIEFGGPVPHALVSEADAREILLVDLDRQSPRAERESRSRAYQALGFWQTAPDLREDAAALAAEQAAAFYALRQKKFFILDRELPGSRLASWWAKRDLKGEEIVSHELVHVLQDRRYGLEDFIHAPRGNDDAELARLAVVEGEAMYFSLKYLLSDAKGDLPALLGLNDVKLDRQSGPTGGAAFDRAAPIERAALLFPAFDGFAFFQAVAKTQGTFGDPLWRHPPGSTAEVLHPEKYAKRWKPAALAFADTAPPPGWRLLRENTVGELALRVLLEGAKETKDDAESLAAGWAGDHYRVYEHEKSHELALAWALAFETPDAARKFVAAYRKFAAAAKKPGEASIASLTGERQVAIIEAPDGATLFAIGLPVLLAH